MSAAVAATALAAFAGACLVASPERSRLRRVTAAPGPADPTPRQLRASVDLGTALVWCRDPTRRRAAARRRGATIELCAGLAAEMSAGGSAREALTATASGLPDLRHLGTVAGAPHGDVAQALRATAALPGAGGLLLLAACWHISERSGGSLAPSAARLALGLRDDEQVRREVAAQLAGPRATGVLLAVLPVFGLLMGTAIGAHPLAVLVGTTVGRGCLAMGLALELIGLFWTAHIIRRAEPP